MPDTTIQSTTQQFLDIYDITNNVLIMKNGTTSVVITVDAMNFGLLAEEEQDGIMYAYAGLLNSLNYPIQIVIKSQTKDVTGYLHLLQEQEEKTTNRNIQRRIREYREFVANLIHDRNVLDKKFYVVIPATALELGLLSAQSVLPGSKEFDITKIEKTMIIEKALTILEPKRDHLISQFSRIGLFSKQLTTQELIQLFYVSYNPEAIEGQQLADTKNYTTPLVTTGVRRAFMNDQPSISSQVNPIPHLDNTDPQEVAPAPAPNSPTLESSPVPTSTPLVPVEPEVSPQLPLASVPTPTSSITPTTPQENEIKSTSPTPISIPSSASTYSEQLNTKMPDLTLAQEEINKTLGQLNSLDATNNTTAQNAEPNANALPEI
ncbi:MAG: hypothetical protein WAU07_00330 [Microgenomates group bacterium]